MFIKKRLISWDLGFIKMVENLDTVDFIRLFINYGFLGEKSVFLFVCLDYYKTKILFIKKYY